MNQRLIQALPASSDSCEFVQFVSVPGCRLRMGEGVPSRLICGCAAGRKSGTESRVIAAELRFDKVRDEVFDQVPE